MLTIGFSRQRFSATFRERMAEWGLSLALLLWGIYVLTSPGLFAMRPYFAPLARIMPQAWWGGIAAAIGIGRLVMLAVNGGWRPSAGWRAAGCAVGGMGWVSLMVGALSVEWRSPAAGIYFTLYLMDMISGWYAARDAVSASYAHGR